VELHDGGRQQRRQEEAVTLIPTADSYVSSGAAGSNYGGGTVLDVDGSPVNIGYLKFNLAPYAGRSVNSASLQLRVSSSGSVGQQNVKLVTDDSCDLSVGLDSSSDGVDIASRETGTTAPRLQNS
jgi:hypothetical protein